MAPSIAHSDQIRNILNQANCFLPAETGVGDGLTVAVLADLVAAGLDIALDHQPFDQVLDVCGVAAAVKHFLGDAPAYKVVEAVGFQCQLYAAFMANGFTQCALVGRRDFGQYAAVCTACMGADLFQIVDGFARNAFSLAASAAISNTSG